MVGGGEDTTSPYSVSWDTTTVPNGVHTIIARARDTSGNTGDSLPVSVTVSNTQLAGLVAAYSFDEGTGTTANDSSGQANTATLNNGVAWVAGQHGKAASFDGVNDYITIPNSASTNISGNALTLSMWINPQPLASGDSVVIGKFWNTTSRRPSTSMGWSWAEETELTSMWERRADRASPWRHDSAIQPVVLPCHHLRWRAGQDLCQRHPRQHASAVGNHHGSWQSHEHRGGCFDGAILQGDA